ncbi:hypothetical protein J3F83DRAFT_739264 [Trichoderma novae-zelandiae]
MEFFFLAIFFCVERGGLGKFLGRSCATRTALVCCMYLIGRHCRHCTRTVQWDGAAVQGPCEFHHLPQRVSPVRYSRIQYRPLLVLIRRPAPATIWWIGRRVKPYGQRIQTALSHDRPMERKPPD